jgi:ubiquitin carboxyl-terminal hydrolase 22/27/51
MDDVFAETFGAGPGPGAPVMLLAALWRSSTELAGYSQQDAHEAFVALRNGLHATARGSTQTSCNCVVHEAFGGTLQSTIVCGKCGNETRTGDPMLDVPLVVRGEETLAGCLRR